MILIFKHVHVDIAQDLLDIAISKSKKLYFRKGMPKELIEVKKAKKISQTITSRLDNILSNLPIIRTLNHFYQDLFRATIDADEYKKSSYRVRKASKTVKKLQKEYLSKIKKNPSIKRQFIGRISSVVDQISDNLDFLKKTYRKFKQFPTIKLDTPTIIISGFPNVGKSSLLKLLTGAEPKIKPYPFTTQGISLGYMKKDYLQIQCIDTPGLLDRSIKDRNKIELKSIAALKHLSDHIIFIFDPTEDIYSIEDQLNLYNELSEFLNKDLFSVVNKIDKIKNKDEIKIDGFQISCKEGKNIDKLKEICFETLISKIRK